ncbi:hypothetical protein ACFLZP_04340 [Patescibacteria group bacterium]
MKVLQWSITIPKQKQPEFINYLEKVLGPTWKKFGCQKHEIYKVADKASVGKQKTERNRFIERLYFNNDFDLKTFFASVRKDEEANRISRSYEEVFGATNIQLRILLETNA